MQKKIGVFIGEIAQNYQKIVADNIVLRANSLGYDVVFVCNYGSYNDDILYAEGEKACISLPDCSEFDGIIVAEDVLDIYGMPEALYSLLSAEAKCPVVYLRATKENCYGIVLEGKESIESMVRHFTDVHNFTDICYMSGKQGDEGAVERLEGYKNVMEEKGIEVTEHMIFHGDFWRNKGKEAVDWFMEDRDTYPQAIVCANDYMALSVCEELRNRNVRVPEDVCVSGFDFVDDAKYNEPTLTSMEVDFEGMVLRAVDTIDSVNKGKDMPKVQKIRAKLRLHKSCGCGKQMIFKDVSRLLEANHYFIADNKDTLLSVTDYQDTFEFDEYMSVAYKYRRFLKTREAYFCFCDNSETGFDAVENDAKYTSRVVLKRIFRDDGYEKCDITFPRRKIIPDEYWSDEEANNLFVFTIHFKNVVYGYVVARMTPGRWFDIFTQTYLSFLANAIENGEVHKEMEHLETIRSLYQKDALTGILNRRGFDKRLQDLYSDYQLGGKPFCLASIDMDNLKVINDNFGHAEGDRAIVALANALEASMGEGDFCARIGGDEFSAVLCESYPGRSSEFKKDFLAGLLKESNRINEYDVGASVGICEVNESSATSLVACIQLADSRMYEEKRNRKMHRD